VSDYGQLLDEKEVWFWFVDVLEEFFLEQLIQLDHPRIDEREHRRHCYDPIEQFLRK
jgi:hypothetical protein